MEILCFYLLFICLNLKRHFFIKIKVLKKGFTTQKKPLKNFNGYKDSLYLFTFIMNFKYMLFYHMLCDWP